MYGETPFVSYTVCVDHFLGEVVSSTDAARGVRQILRVFRVPNTRELEKNKKKKSHPKQ